MQPVCSICLEGDHVINQNCGCVNGYFHSRCFEKYQIYNPESTCKVCKRKYKGELYSKIHKWMYSFTKNNYEQLYKVFKYYVMSLFIYDFCRMAYEQKTVEYNWIYRDIFTMTFLLFLHIYPVYERFSLKRYHHLISSFMMTIYSNILVATSNDKLPFIYLFLSIMHLPFMCVLLIPI